MYIYVYIYIYTHTHIVVLGHRGALPPGEAAEGSECNLVTIYIYIYIR